VAPPNRGTAAALAGRHLAALPAIPFAAQK
jgi:hypothetical protein